MKAHSEATSKFMIVLTGLYAIYTLLSMIIMATAQGYTPVQCHTLLIYTVCTQK